MGMERPLVSMSEMADVVERMDSGELEPMNNMIKEICGRITFFEAIKDKMNQ